MNKKLLNFFYSPQDDLKYIQVYEENSAYFANLISKGHAPDLESVLPIKLFKYADPLIQTGNYSKAERVLEQVEKDLGRLKGRSKLYEQYAQSLIFLRGVALSRQKRYAASNAEFRKILTKQPYKDNYVYWYKANQKNMVDRFATPVLVTGVVIFLILLAVEYLVDIKLKWPQNIALAIGLSSFIMQYFLNLYIDKRTI